jgi:lipid-A-disaccharide synthase
MMAAGNMRRVLIVAGEASGDLHGANLIRAARDVDPGLCFFGMGGAKMAAAGCDIRIDMRELAVMGLVEVATRLPAIRKAFKTIKALFSGNERPDLLVLIDYPGFNLRLAREAKRSGIPILYYICPKIWASRPGRKKQIVRDIDRLAAIFPFEVQLFSGEPIKVEYVGNPLLDEYHEPAPRSEVLQRHGLDPAGRVVGLFPGSRRSEIRYILPTILETAKQLLQRYSDIQFLMPLAPNLHRDELELAMQQYDLRVSLVQDDIYDLSAACEVILSVSGTVTLQAALTGTPMAILYKASALTYAIGKRLVRIPLVGLPNIVAGKEIVREFIQDAADPVGLAGELGRLLDDQTYFATVADNLAAVKERLGTPGCSERVAGMVREMVCQ